MLSENSSIGTPPASSNADADDLLALPPNTPRVETMPEAFPGCRIDIYFEPIYNVYQLARAQNVRTGIIAFAPHNREPFDRERFPEVYLDGEKIAKDDFRNRDSVEVVEFAESPGRFSVQVKQSLVGISVTQNDVASALFLFFLRIEDPRKYLAGDPGWVTIEGRERLRTTITKLIARDVKSTLDEDIQLWSAPHVGEVADSIRARLDDKLKEWGLRLRRSVIAERKYPERMNALALEFRTAEQEFLDLDRAKKAALRERLGLQPSDLVEIQNISEKRGRGAGLLMAAKKRRYYIEPFIEWLNGKSGPAFTAASFLEEIYLEKKNKERKYSLAEIELSEQVLQSAIRNPVLGLGEWGDTEQKMADISEYRILEDYLQIETQPSQPTAKPA